MAEPSPRPWHRGRSQATSRPLPARFLPPRSLPLGGRLRVFECARGSVATAVPAAHVGGVDVFARRPSRYVPQPRLWDPRTSGASLCDEIAEVVTLHGFPRSDDQRRLRHDTGAVSNAIRTSAGVRVAGKPVGEPLDVLEAPGPPPPGMARQSVTVGIQFSRTSVVEPIEDDSEVVMLKPL